jgi:hypothetical protein
MLTTKEAQEQGIISGWQITQELSDRTWTVTMGGRIVAQKCADLFVAILVVPISQRGDFTKEAIVKLAKG